jgi:hypothetical protein
MYPGGLPGLLKMVDLHWGYSRGQSGAQIFASELETRLPGSRLHTTQFSDLRAFASQYSRVTTLRSLAKLKEQK